MNSDKYTSRESLNKGFGKLQLECTTITRKKINLYEYHILNILLSFLSQSNCGVGAGAGVRVGGTFLNVSPVK
jgi:hypothetical protein